MRNHSIRSSLALLILLALSSKGFSQESSLHRWIDPLENELPTAVSDCAQDRREPLAKAADAIARAHQLGMQNLADTVPVLIALLEAPNQHPVVQLSSARALIVLDARQSADALFTQARTGWLMMSQLVEPALVAWNYAPARPLWLTRLRDPRTPRQLLVLAIRGIAPETIESAETRLREIAMRRRHNEL